MMLADQNASDDAEAVNYPLSCEISCLGWVSFTTRALLMHLLHAAHTCHPASPQAVVPDVHFLTSHWYAYDMS